MTKPFLMAVTGLLAALPSVAAPSIAAQGVKNAASYVDPRLPNGSIAQGSIFNVFGSAMGPSAIAYASTLPLPTSLSGTSISVTVNGTAEPCYMFYNSAGQLAAILPSTTPAGTGTIGVPRSRRGNISLDIPFIEPKDQRVSRRSGRRCEKFSSFRIVKKRGITEHRGLQRLRDRPIHQSRCRGR